MYDVCTGQFARKSVSVMCLGACVAVEFGSAAVFAIGRVYCGMQG